MAKREFKVGQRVAVYCIELGGRKIFKIGDISPDKSLIHFYKTTFGSFVVHAKQCRHLKSCSKKKKVKVFEVTLTDGHGPQRLGSFIPSCNLNFDKMLVSVNGQMVGNYRENRDHWLMPTTKVKLFVVIKNK